jgi:hypothetical protein
MKGNFVIDQSVPHVGGNVRYGDLSCTTPRLWRALIERFAVRSMLDVGSGEGHAVLFFHRAGVVAHGIDGLMKNVERSVFPVAYHDLTTGPYVMPVDLTLSVEVAEHIEVKYVNNYTQTLCNGKIVVMTHAVPGQPGHHHVNCRPADYWICQMASHGYELDHENAYWRQVAAGEGHFTFFGETGLVFLRSDN